MNRRRCFGVPWRRHIWQRVLDGLERFAQDLDDANRAILEDAQLEYPTEAHDLDKPLHPGYPEITPRVLAADETKRALFDSGVEIYRDDLPTGSVSWYGARRAGYAYAHLEDPTGEEKDREKLK